MARTATIVRETSESKVELSLNLDGTGKTDIDTSVPFYNHMMTALGKHSLIDLKIKATGDTDIDAHHTVEDIAIVFGEALKQALGDKRGIRRFADATVPLDEALAKAVVDISGRPYCVCTGEPEGFEYCMIGGHFTGSLVRHVMESIAMHAGICLHLHVISGRDPHHIAEAEFKALARALRFAMNPIRARRHSQHEGRAVMSDDKDDLNGFDGLGKTNDDGMHFSEEELEAAMAGFEKEFQDEEVAQQNDAPAQVPFDQPDETVNSDASSDESQDGLQSKEADAVLSEAENSLSFDDELQGLLGNRAKVAVIITRLASARLFAAFCQLSDISAQCLASPQGAVAVLRNLDGDGPEAAIKDLTTVVSGMPAVLAINRADKLEATMYLQGKVGQTFAPPVLLTSTAPFVEDLLLGITDVQGVRDSGVETVDSASLTRDDAMKILAEHTRFGRGSSSIE